MLYYLHYLMDAFSPLRIFQYITFRAFAGAGTAFMLSLLMGPSMIRALRRFKIGQQIREEIVDVHGGKKGVPTMGGLLIISSVLISCLLWAVPTNRYVVITLLTLLYMGGVGFLDDFLKLRKKQSEGLTVKAKFTMQVFWAVVVVLFLWVYPETRPLVQQLMAPFFKHPIIPVMPLPVALIFLSIVIVGATNAVNITDGLDGLAIGCSNSVALAYFIMSYVAGHAVFARYLQVPFIPGAGELTVFCGCLLGAGLGFLWFNCHPARVFMGDTGSLALGGSIAMVAILIMQELMLLIVGGVFVIEALSVMVQVGFFKFTRLRYGEGRRVFKRAPLHHHFELVEKECANREGRDLEVVETMITTRFWIISIIFALIGIASLKIR
ncbi:MAG: phospho-N-acetylmuramoyl-pentapeptide-transferase [Spartobacteria bacterium]|nr:phospho-N-acetylmuramoyl-pentapeptide-transferase [Spartobacteria bacterium]